MSTLPGLEQAPGDTALSDDRSVGTWLMFRAPSSGLCELGQGRQKDGSSELWVLLGELGAGETAESSRNLRGVGLRHTQVQVLAPPPTRSAVAYKWKLSASQLPHLQRNDDWKIRLDNSSVPVSLSVCLAVLGHLMSSSPRGIKTGPVEPEPQGWGGEHLLVAGGDLGGAAPTWQGLGRLSQGWGELCEHRAVKTTVTGHLPKLR